MNTYYDHKVFLDELRPKEVKDREKAEKEAKRAERDARKQALSMEPRAGGARRQTIDNNRSIPAQGRAANVGMTHSQGQIEADVAAQYEVEYPAKLKELFEEDNSDDSYDLPFK